MDGDYAWAMQESMMLGYARDGRTIAKRWRRHRGFETIGRAAMKIAPLILACLLAASASTMAAQDLKHLARDAKSSVLLLRIYDGFGREVSSGSGFFISSDGLLATNYHVIDAARRIEAVPAEGEPLAVRGLVAKDEVNDLAVLRLDTRMVHPLPLAAADVRDPGERVVVLGGPLGLAGSLSEGIVSAIRDASELEIHRPGAAPLLQITAAISPGSSGSPVMTYDGEVVGVVVSQSRVGQNLNFAVPVTALRNLLEGIGPDTPETPFGLASSASRSSFLRNLLISAAFFAVLYFALKRMK